LILILGLFIVGFFTLCFICFDIDENEIIADEQLNDGVDSCRSKLNKQCEDDCLLTHEQLDNVVPIEMDPQNGMMDISFLLLIFVTYLRVNVNNCHF
jgi:hypothetical protein